MNILRLFAIGLLFGAADGLATAIYRCNSPDGVTFSERPCGAHAVQVKAETSAPASTSHAARPGEFLSLIDSAKFGALGVRSASAIIAVVGRPTATYRHGGTEHWLYPNAIRRSELGAHAPEILLKDGKSFQINWLPEDVMHKAVAIAKGFANWAPPEEIREKGFSLSDPMLVGTKKSSIIKALGQPDGKRVSNGNEIWEYQKVRLALDKPETVTIYLEFDGDVVTNSVGN
jgi:hypothetical protein